MSQAARGPRFGPDELLDPERARAVLERWDELDREHLERLERHPHYGPKLATLRAAERWLAEQAGAEESPSGCPTAEELYDFGRGPGYAQLDPRRRAQLEAHVRGCSECEELVVTLAAPPPVPLDFEPHKRELSPLAPLGPVITGPVNTSPVGRRPVPQARRPAARRWAPLAMAAALLALLGLWALNPTRDSLGAGPKPDPMLRGRSAQSLYFPRERVLAPSSLLHTGWPALAPRLGFEIAPQAGAESYHIVLYRAGEGAFARGERIWIGDSAAPSLELVQPLEPGRYTWEAWFTQRGIEQALGARDFEVRPDVALDRALSALAAIPPEERVAHALVLLDAGGWDSDARALARSLPAGELRERWLAPIPGR